MVWRYSTHKDRPMEGVSRTLTNNKKVFTWEQITKVPLTCMSETHKALIKYTNNLT